MPHVRRRCEYSYVHQAGKLIRVYMFAGTSICKILLVAKLRYVFQILDCARLNIQKFHRVFSLFIWTVDSEPMRHDNTFPFR